MLLTLLRIRSSRQGPPDIVFPLSSVQEYIVDGSNRTVPRPPILFPLYQGGDPNGADTGDYSSYGYQYGYFYNPFQEVGKHELECFATASAAGFNPDPIVTAAVSARFTGQCAGPGGPTTRRGA
jgi:hypothetical protein